MTVENRLIPKIASAALVAVVAVAVVYRVVPNTHVDVMVILHQQGLSTVARVVVSNVQVLAAGTNIELVSTENNNDAGAQGRQSTSLVNGLYYADSLAQLMKTEFNALVWWDLRNGTDTTGAFDSGLYGWRTYGDLGMVNGLSTRHPTFYAAKLMSAFIQAGDLVVSASSDYPLLSAYASRNSSGELSMLVLHKDRTTNFNAQITLNGFVPGQTAEALREEDAPIDPEARRAHGLWKGTPIKLETDFIIRRKLTPTLEAVNAGLDTVVKAQVYLRDQEDIPGFREVWARHFPVQPATTIIATATPGFIMPESRIEINTIALAKNGKTAKQVIAPVPPLFQGASTAIRAGDLLFISGLMAVCDGSLVPGAKADPTQPFYAVPVKSELREILAQAEAICQAAGTTLKNAVRIQQFHASLADLPATLEVWSEAMDGMPLPLSPIEVPWLPVPDARLQLDLWIYIPD
jgi:enamine deaminase RidA (YjgF/YER057c/UK114 family)